MRKLLLGCGAATALSCLCGGAALRAQDTAAVASAPLTVKEVMEKTITPATNTLWSVPAKPTVEEWLVLEEAAVTLLVAANAVGAGGAGPMDGLWARQPAWQAFNRTLFDAGSAALAAVRARDLPALANAGDALYPPCAGCHKAFNPGLVDPR